MDYLATLMLMMSLQVGDEGGAEEALQHLDELRWTRRIILVAAPADQAGRAVERLGVFAFELEERQVTWFVLGPDRLRTNHAGPIGEDLADELANRYFDTAKTAVTVVLIGKDGTVKSRSQALDLERLMDQIDRMPMRQREMQEQRLP